MVAIAGGFGNRPRDFVRIDAAIGRGLCEIPRLAIRQRGMRTAFLTLGETLIDAVAIGLVFNDEDAAIRQRS